jgi:probable rRNA maturation factor
VLWQSGRRLATDRAIREAVKAAFDQAGKEAPSIDVVLVDDRTLARIHGRFLGDPRPTDVIAFDLSDESDAWPARAGGGGGIGAEIYASHECALRVAAERGVDPGRELALYVVHGALHLCGFDDHSARGRKRMRTAESKVLDGLGYAPDRGPHP